MGESSDEEQLIFISYAHENRGWIEALRFDKEPDSTGNAQFWTDYNHLHPSDRWNDEATKALEKASAVVLLISEEFLKSDSIRDHELPVIMKRYREEHMHVVLVPIGNVDTEEVGRQLEIDHVHNLISIPPWQKPLPVQAEPREEVRLEIISAAAEPPEVQSLRRNIQSKYRLIDSLGEGPLGRVFTAYDQELDRQVAIKLLRRQSGDRLFKDSVKHVSQATDHSNILTVYSASLDQYPPYYVRQHVEGVTLRYLLDDVFKGRQLALSLVQELLPAVSAAIVHAHRNGVSKLNIKPSNVIVVDHSDPDSRDYKLSLNSYDEAALLNDESRRDQGYDALYLPPEYRVVQAGVEPSSPEKADQYRLGLMAYEMLLGSSGFLAEADRLDFSSADWQWPLISENRQDCPHVFRQAVDKMISTRPQKRYDSLDRALKYFESSDLDVELVRESYHRLLKSSPKQTEFFHKFYVNFLDKCPPALEFFKEKKFGPLDAGTSPSKAWQRQFQVLKEAILLLAIFKSFHEDGREPNILTRIAEEHAQRGIPEWLYDDFRKVLVKTVVDMDSDWKDKREMKRVWRRVVQPGIKYMKKTTRKVEKERGHRKDKG